MADLVPEVGPKISTETTVKASVAATAPAEARHNRLFAILGKFLHRGSQKEGITAGPDQSVKPAVPEVVGNPQTAASVREEQLPEPEVAEAQPQSLREALDARLAKWHTWINAQIINDERRKAESAEYVAGAKTAPERIARKLQIMSEDTSIFPPELLRSANQAMTNVRLIVKPK